MIMLIPGLTYTRNDGIPATIMGRIRDYSMDAPYLWSLQGNWYDEKTGRFVSYSDKRGGRFLLPADNGRSISNHCSVPHDS